MKYWMIVKSGIERKRIRTIMTVLSIAVAFTLFSLGRSVAVAFNSEIDYAGKDRLIVSSRLSFTDGLPLAHKNRIETLDGVKAVAYRGLGVLILKEQTFSLNGLYLLNIWTSIQS